MERGGVRNEYLVKKTRDYRFVEAVGGSVRVHEGLSAAESKYFGRGRRISKTYRNKSEANVIYEGGAGKNAKPATQ